MCDSLVAMVVNYMLSFFLLYQLCVMPFATGSGGDVTPKDPVVLVGGTLNLTCSLDQQQYNASDIYFTKGAKRFSGDKVTVVSSNMAQLKLENMQLEDSGTYKCCVAVGNESSVWINNQYVQVGYPPDTPSNLTCISYNQENMTCTWNTGRATYLKTTYELLWSRDSVHFSPCPSRPSFSSSTCTWVKNDKQDTFWPNTDYYFIVNASNQLGSRTLLDVQKTNATIVKPNPVRNLTAFPSSGNSSSITVQWLAPKLNILLGPPLIAPGLIYRMTWTSQWNLTGVRVLTEFKYNTSFSANLQGLTPYTQYNISVVVQPFGGKYWSDVADTLVQTAESVPAAPPGITRGCFQHDIQNKNLFVYWQEIPRQLQNGVILNYLVSWKKTSVDATDSSYLARYPPHSKLVPKGEVGTWTLIDNASPVSRWEIQINAETSKGASQHHALMIIAPLETRPGLPRDLYIEVSSENVAFLYWKPPKEKADAVTGYTIYWCLGRYAEFGCQGNLFWQNVSSNSTSYQLQMSTSEDVREDYRFAVSADSSNSSSGMVWPHVKCNYLYDKAPDIYPVGFSLKEESLQLERSLHVKWAALDCTKGTFSRVLYYNIRICELPELCSKGKYFNVTIQHQDSYIDYVDYVIEGLKPFTRYHLAIQAVTAAGGGPFNVLDDPRVRTLQSAPGLPPQGLRQTAITSSTVTLVWEPSPQPNGDVSKYQIYMLGQSSPVLTTTGDILFTTIDKLEGYKVYQFMVAACTDNGTKCSDLSQPLQVNTSIGAPGVVDSFKVQVTGSTGQIASVTWDPPGQPNGPIAGYILHINSSAGEQERFIDIVTDVEKYLTHDNRLHTQVMPCTDETEHMAINFSIQASNSLGQLGPLSHVEETYMCQIAVLPDGVVGGIVAGCIIGGACIALLVFFIYRTSMFCKKKLIIPPEEIPELPPPINIDDYFDYDSGSYNNNSKFLMSEIDETKLGYNDLDLLKFMKQNSIDSGIFTPSPVSEQDRRFSFNGSGNSAHGSESSSLATIRETGEGQEEAAVTGDDTNEMEDSTDYLAHQDDKEKAKATMEQSKLTHQGKHVSPVRSICSDSGNGSSSDYYYSKMAVNNLIGEEMEESGDLEEDLIKEGTEEKQILCASVIPAHQPEVIVAHAQLVLANHSPHVDNGGAGEDLMIELHSKLQDSANMTAPKASLLSSSKQLELEKKEIIAKKLAQQSTMLESSSSGMGYSCFGLGKALGDMGTDQDLDLDDQVKDSNLDLDNGQGDKMGSDPDSDQEFCHSDKNPNSLYSENTMEKVKDGKDDEEEGDEEECVHASIPLLSHISPSSNHRPIRNLNDTEDNETTVPLLDHALLQSTSSAKDNVQDGCQKSPQLFPIVIGSGYVTQDDIIGNGVICSNGYVANC